MHLAARGLETEWEKRLRDLAAAEAELQRRELQRPRAVKETRCCTAAHGAPHEFRMGLQLTYRNEKRAHGYVPFLFGHQGRCN